MVKVGVIVGSTRPDRVGSRIAGWVAERAGTLTDVDIDLIELAEVALPFLDEPEHPSTMIYTHQHTRDWSARIEALNAIILVTPEYNSSFPAPLKNALDYLWGEWQDKPVAMVGYGLTSSGTRGVQALQPVVAALGMVGAGSIYVPLRQRLNEAGSLEMTDRDAASADELFAKLVRLSRALAPMVAASA